MKIHPDSYASGVEVSTIALGPNLPQRIGRRLWLPTLAMALMAFPVALLLAFLRAQVVAAGGAQTSAAALGQFEVAAMFLGFATVFGGVSFAIARILGVLRSGGGAVQEAAGSPVHTLPMPVTGKLFLGLMAMAMMALLAAVSAHVFLGVTVLGAGKATLASVQSWSEFLEGLRRLAVSTYLLAIALGLATIVRILHFQAIRIRELPGERTLGAGQQA
jgi:hypothetical protein